jgi:polysaccharide chain length determinant protein (PEP-CTERM system associated)
MEPKAFHPLDYLAVVNRRKLWFAVPLVLCIAAGAVAVSVWPKKYLSRAAIGVQSPTLSPELLRGLSSMDPVERQRSIQQLLLSPTVLDRVIREEQIARTKPTAEVAAWLRDNLTRNLEVPPAVGLNGRPDPARGIDMFFIGYTDGDAARSQRIANRIATVFVEENSRVQTNRAENTAEVLEQQVKASQAQLAELEGKMRVKKQNFVGSLPEQMGANVQMANGARSQFESLSLQIRSEQAHLSMVESQLSEMRQGLAGASSTSYAALTAAQKRVEDLDNQLTADRSLGYTDMHPDIQRLQRELKQARTDLQAAKTQQPAHNDEALKADPQYRAKVQERDLAQLHIRELQSASEAAQRQIGSYQKRVETAPVAEQELASLDREYSLEKVRYSDLTARFSSAQMAEDVARKQGGERFSVLYPAGLPKDPIEPQPMKIMAMAVVAGLVLGACAAIGREFLDRSVHDSRALQNEFELPVLGEIPRIA